MNDAIVIAALAALPGVITGIRAIVEVRKVHMLVNSQKDALTHLLQDALRTITTLERAAIESQHVIKSQVVQLEAFHRRASSSDGAE